uniref:Uncharacterized protein n=1 Tax=Salmo trutta TaxID=8032 RepID=A0A674EYE8_SALTR
SGSSSSRQSSPIIEDKALHFLSQEEQDCILFFEETIDSLPDIIDLVRPAQPDLVHPTHAPFNPPMPGTAQFTPCSTLNMWGTPTSSLPPSCPTAVGTSI